MERIRSLVAALMLATIPASGQFQIGTRNFTPAGGAPPSPVSAVHAMTGTVGVCSGASTCTFNFPNSPASGNRLVLFAIVNHGGATLTIASLTGSGCPTSFGSPVTNVATANSAIGEYAWTGVAAGSGACAVGLDAGGFFSNWDIGSGEFANAIGVETFGSAANNAASTLAITAGGATTVAGDYAIVCWGANAASGSAVATGWTSDFNGSTLGGFHQSGVSSGTTLTFSGSPISNGSAENIGIMVVLKA